MIGIKFITYQVLTTYGNKSLRLFCNPKKGNVNTGHSLSTLNGKFLIKNYLSKIIIVDFLKVSRALFNKDPRKNHSDEVLETPSRQTNSLTNIQH